MMDDRGFGFTEIEHTADWALKVWAPDLSLLFAQAAVGMYWLMETSLKSSPRIERSLVMEGVDPETLLVGFLSELLYLGESEGLGFNQFEVAFQDTGLPAGKLSAVIVGAPIATQKKEIKAVTYHNLEVHHTEQGVTVTIVFDV